MKLPLALAALILTAGLARADIVIIQKVDGAGQTGQMTVKVGGDKVRTDINPQVSVITDASTGGVTTLMHTQKTFMIIPAAASKAMADQMAKVMQQSGAKISPSPAAPTATGKTDKINGYNAAEYTFTNGSLKATYWVSSDFPNAKAVNDALAKFRKGGLADMTKAFAPDISTMPGVPVRTEMEFNGQKIVTDLISVTDQTVDPKEYLVPPDYTEMKLPTMPQQQ